VTTPVPPPKIWDGTRIRLHELASRPDGEEVIVGRPATGDFVALPAVGARAIELLGQNLTAGEARRVLVEETGADLDICDFVSDLTALGFVAEVDGVLLPSTAPPPATFPWLTPRLAAWSLRPIVPMALGTVVAAAVIVLAGRPQLMPGYHDLLWSPYGSLVLLVMFSVGWPLLLLHETAHLIVARAAGVPARIELGTRLQFLVMQTDMSGIEVAPRRHRLTAYLAGITVNLTIAATGVLALAATSPHAPAHGALAILVLLALIPLPFEGMIFMRTDVYFVLQDLTGCRDLFGDGRAYVHYLARSVLSRGKPRLPDPSRQMAPAQRHAVRVYSAVLLTGTVLCLAVLAMVTAPADLTMLVHAVRRIGPGHSSRERLDGLAVLLFLGGPQTLWARTRWRQHRARKLAHRLGSNR
jgi:putative peptide zinc metalloprotease protein